MLKGKRQLIGFDRMTHRRDRLQIGPQRGDIGVAHPRVSRIGHRRIEPLAAGRDAFAHGAAEIALRSSCRCRYRGPA